MTKWMGLDVPFWLIVAVGLGLVLLVIVQAPSSSNSGSRHPNRSAKNKRGKAEEPPASDAARGVGKRLGIGGAVRAGGSRRRVPVTVCVNDVVLRKGPDGDWVAIESAVRVLALLNEVASVFLVAWVQSDLDESLVKDIALSSGLTGPSGRDTSDPSAALTANATGIPEHRLLFCSSHIGQVAVVRQLTPSLHIGGPIALLEGICRFVPSLLRIDPSAVDPPPETTVSPTAPSEKETGRRDGGYALEWREFKSLAAAAGLESAAGGEAQGAGSSASCSSGAESDIAAVAGGPREQGAADDTEKKPGVVLEPSSARGPKPSDGEGVGETFPPLPTSPPAVS
ncbi:unnamed protein product [Ectocarpus sp. CCAP 1310/34]|nr:unnamed protein product [Ectocarpus sp. CCAP 1310/34]